MGSSRSRNSTRARKARSAKHTPLSRRRASRPPHLTKQPTVHAELLSVRERLTIVAAHAYVVGAALSAERSAVMEDIARVVRISVRDEVERQIEALQRIGARIKGGPRS